MSTTFAAAFAVGTCLIVQTPPQTEVQWLPVEQLTASAEQVVIDVAPPKSSSSHVVVITGLVPITRQSQHVADRLSVSKTFAEKTTYPVDFTIQRQQLPIDANPKKLPDWETLPLEHAANVLASATKFQRPIVGSEKTDDAITMPLPALRGQAWPASVSHPNLTQNELLFRFVDFAVQPEHHYRYRVRIEFRNPQWQSSTDPFTSAGPTRHTPWCVPSNSVAVRQSK